MLWLALVFMGACAAAFVALPFLGHQRESAAAASAGEDLRAELASIDAGLARGELNAEGAEAARIDAQRRALRPADAPAADAAPANRRAAAIVAAALIVSAGLLYALTGQPEAPSAPGVGQSAAEAQLSRLIATLQQHLREAPDNADGWRALGWAYFMGAQYQQSGAAYERAIALRPESAVFRSAYGESLVGAAQGVVTPAAATAFQEALKRDKADVRARFYLGLLKAQNNDAKGAIADWLALYKQAPPGSDAAQDLQARIKTLAAQSGIDVSAQFPAAGGPNAAQVDDAAKMSDQERDAMIDAMVATLDQRLRANPRDLDGWTRLVHARVVQGKIDDANDALRRARGAFPGDEAAQGQLDQLAAESGLERGR